MILGEPGHTLYDVHFEIFGFPVRIHPWFWAVTGILGASGARDVPNMSEAAASVLIWVSAVFVSILLHEIGHAVLMRRAGMGPHIVLYAMGGLAVPGDRFNSPYGSSFGSSFGQRPTKASKFNWEWIFISFAGPAVNLIIAGLLAAAIYAGGGGLRYFPPAYLFVQGVDNPYLREMLQSMMHINGYWALVNLLPIYPLDGGQISREFFIGFDPWNGLRNALWLSLIVAAGMALTGLGTGESGMFMLFFFGSLAFMNYQMIQASSGGGGRPW